MRQQQLQQALQESGQFLDEPFALPGAGGDEGNVAPLDTKMLQAAAAAVAALAGADNTAPLDATAVDSCVSYLCFFLYPVPLFFASRNFSRSRAKAAGASKRRAPRAADIHSSSSPFSSSDEGMSQSPPAVRAPKRQRPVLAR